MESYGILCKFTGFIEFNGNCERIYIMELFLAHHEIFIQLIRYGLALIGAGWLCLKYLFPILGRGIVELNLELQKRIAKLKADEDKWKQNVREQFEEDVTMGMDEVEIRYQERPKSNYKRRWIPAEQREPERGKEE